MDLLFLVYHENFCIVFLSCCMFVPCVHPVAVLNAAFYMSCSLLMLVEDARGYHIEEPYSRDGLMTALYVAMSGPLLFTPSCCGE